jgi:hypothetical protein
MMSTKKYRIRLMRHEHQEFRGPGIPRADRRVQANSCAHPAEVALPISTNMLNYFRKEWNKRTTLFVIIGAPCRQAAKRIVWGVIESFSHQGPFVEVRKRR